MTDPRLQFSQFVGTGGQFVVRTETIDELKEGIDELVEASVTLAGAVTAFQTAFGVSGGNSTPNNAPASTQKKTYTRTQKPGAPAGDVPNCNCGVPMNDVRGKVYKAGAKAGQPYPNSFYPGNDCQGGCKAQ